MRVDFNPFISNKRHYLNQQNNATVSCAKNFQNPIEKSIYDNSFGLSLIYFTGNTDNTTFDVTKIPSMKCPICEQIMLNPAQVQEFIINASKKKGDELIEFLEKYEDDRNFCSDIKKASGKTIYRKDQQKVVDIIKELAKKYPNCNIKGLVNKKANEISKYYGESVKRNYVDNFFISAADRNITSEKIANKIIYPSSSSKEHIHPRGKGGANRLSNYLCDCTGCNNKRHELDFKLWQNQLPNLEKSLQEHLYDIQKAISKGQLDKAVYEQYIKDLIETINVQSDGKILLQEPVKDELVKKYEVELKTKTQTVSELHKLLNAQREKLIKLSLENADFRKDEEYRSISLYLRCLGSNNRTEALLKKAKKELERIKRNEDKSPSRKANSRYYARANSLEAEIRKLEKKKQRLQKEKQTYSLLIEPERQLMHLDVNDKDYDIKMQKKKRLKKIHNKIKSNQTKINKLQDAIRTNENIIVQLKEFETLSDSEFENLVSQFDRFR